MVMTTSYTLQSSKDLKEADFRLAETEFEDFAEILPLAKMSSVDQLETTNHLHALAIKLLEGNNRAALLLWKNKRFQVVHRLEPMVDKNDRPTAKFLTTTQVGKGAKTNVRLLDAESIMKPVELINWEDDQRLPNWSEVEHFFELKQK